jgi:hypothetical protein
MTTAKGQRILTWCGIVLVILGLLGAIFAQDSMQRDAQFLAIGMGVIALGTARIFVPWAQRRAQQHTDD